MFLLSITLSPREPCYREREYNLNKHPICFSTVTLISFTHESIVAIPPHTSALMDAVHCGHKVTRRSGSRAPAGCSPHPPGGGGAETPPADVASPGGRDTTTRADR